MTIEEHIKKAMKDCPLTEEQEDKLLTGLENYMNEIEQALSLGGVSKCEKSCKNCKYLNGPNKKCIDCDDNYSQWEKSNIC